MSDRNSVLVGILADCTQQKYQLRELIALLILTHTTTGNLWLGQAPNARRKTPVGSQTLLHNLVVSSVSMRFSVSVTIITHLIQNFTPHQDRVQMVL